MFERPHHQRIALRHGEYRESVDIDFLVSDAAGYRELRQLVKATDRLQDRAGWIERCMQAMVMTLPKAVVWQKVRALRKLVKPV